MTFPENHRRLAILLLSISALTIILAAIWLTILKPASSKRTGVTGESIADTATIQQEEMDAVYLSDIAWKSATTGWVAMANGDLPALDASFQGGPLIVAGKSYAKGLGVFPLSQIEYTLDGEYAYLETDIGLSDVSTRASEDWKGEVQFLVYLDGAEAYDSGIVSRGQLPSHLLLEIYGTRELRLVVSAVGEPSPLNYAAWAEARLLRQRNGSDPEKAEGTLSILRRQVAEREQLRYEDGQRIDTLSNAAMSSVGDAAMDEGVSVSFDERKRHLSLRNQSVMVQYGIGGEEHGLLSILHLASQRLILYQADARVSLGKKGTVSVHHDTTSDGQPSFSERQISDPVFGAGKEVEIRLTDRRGEVRLSHRITLFNKGSHLLSQIDVIPSVEIPDSVQITYFDAIGRSNLMLGDRLRYLTDISRLRRDSVRDDGIERAETVDSGKPVFLASDASNTGLLVAAIDETDTTTTFKIAVDPGKITGRLGFATGLMTNGSSTGILRGPRVYVEVKAGASDLDAFDNFRQFLSALYPPMPLPDWVRYQWLSWYTYYMDINDERIRRQVDYIADNLGDLGPWHIIIDAGWYVAEGRPGANWRMVDIDKFPHGLRTLVDYVHSRNIKVVLYFSAPYLDSRQRRGDWLGLKGLIDEHRDWLIPIGEDETRQSFVYDFSNPGLREYMSQLMKDYFLAYDVDGIKIDGLGNAEGAVLSLRERDSFGLVERVRKPAMEIYRFVHDSVTRLKDNAYIESGWLTPLLANGLANTFRYGDEAASFSNGYPQPGLVEHIDYAMQQGLWGQRSNMGAVQANPNDANINEQWLGAALALDAQAVLSFDLPEMSPESLSRYRALLVNYQPFTGSTRYGRAWPKSFATTKGGLTFLGVLNHGEYDVVTRLPLNDYGLSPTDQYAVYGTGDGHFGLTQGVLEAKLGPRSFRLFVLRKEPGVMWTNSSYALESSSRGHLTLVASGPKHLQGFMELYVPGLNSVILDGERLTEFDAADEASVYDGATGRLTLRYDLMQPRRIDISFSSDKN